MTTLKTKAHVNFYENLKEAMMRLQNTVVLYDGEPYYVLTITDHAPDGIFRVYMDKMGDPNGMCHQRMHVPYDWYDEGEMTRGKVMDKFLDDNPGCGLIRKQMNSPKFNKFRPFKLGMCNQGGKIYYLERSPTRHTFQGLTQQMVDIKLVTLSGATSISRGSIGYTRPEFADTVRGAYPSVHDCISNLRDDNITNDGAAFARDFGILKGPADILFLAYKTNAIGYLNNGDTSKVTLSRKFAYCKEVVADLRVFGEITTN